MKKSDNGKGAKVLDLNVARLAKSVEGLAVLGEETTKRIQGIEAWAGSQTRRMVILEKALAGETKAVQVPLEDVQKVAKEIATVALEGILVAARTIVDQADGGNLTPEAVTELSNRLEHLGR